MSTTRHLVVARAQGCCERCHRYAMSGAHSLHHRRPRGMGGTKTPDTPANLVLLCGTGTTGCHGWVESHRAVAIAQGWLVPRRDPRDPADVPVLIDEAWWKLTPYGYHPTDLNPPF